MDKNTLLIVDDEPSIRTLLERRLSAEGYAIVTAQNGTDALSKIKNSPPDLILLDIMMPGMDGYQVKLELNKVPETAHIPIVFLSAKGETRDKVNGLNLGVDDYVTKPFDSEELKARIATILKRHKHYERVSMTDGLTGVYNIAFFKKQISLFFQLAHRYHKIFSLAIIDIDDFKNINDTYGHLAGDLILKTLATILQGTVRETDVITRYGGDEFVIILTETDVNATLHALNRIRTAIKNAHVTYDSDKPAINFDVSIGSCTYDTHFTSEVHMFICADEALYNEKRSKKDERLP